VAQADIDSDVAVAAVGRSVVVKRADAVPTTWLRSQPTAAQHSFVEGSVPNGEVVTVVEFKEGSPFVKVRRGVGKDVGMPGVEGWIQAVHLPRLLTSTLTSTAAASNGTSGSSPSPSPSGAVRATSPGGGEAESTVVVFAHRDNNGVWEPYGPVESQLIKQAIEAGQPTLKLPELTSRAPVARHFEVRFGVGDASISSSEIVMPNMHSNP
jgi:hypothetical protein